jgi:hypothetical protein
LKSENRMINLKSTTLFNTTNKERRDSSTTF